jgi:hypothetical protein
MGELGGFSKRPERDRRQGSGIQAPRPAAPSVPAQPQQRRGPRDRNQCPAGWDAEVWHLTLRFEDYARADGIELRAGRPIIYSEINDLVTRWNMREKSRNRIYVQEVTGCGRRELGEDIAERCWYHWPPKAPAQQTRRALTWVEVVEIIMAELWSRVMDENAVDHFRSHFAEYGLAMAQHWKSLRIKREIASRPQDAVRPIVRRRASSGTIAGDSKEG